ncbi:STAS domain-containing protein [Ferrimonas marina]|uniref:STAS domain-containing protein n=1 Tax=Ferrimonas marina TaxID=299255 RepID=A0A1M5Y280_9GAMM|nr:STAS domain-containing protein [Ferrimonas marina]SHI06076.1 STAS domain-containing protein [Ferrimonas marina]
MSGLEHRLEGDSLWLNGVLNEAVVMSLWSQLDSWQQVTTLELGALKQIDSAGLALLLELESRARVRQQPLQWLSVPAAMQRLMGLYDLQLAEGRLGAHTEIEEQNDGTE